MKISCLHPFVREISQLKDELGFPLRETYPCGKCVLCLERNAKDWVLRLNLESKQSTNIHFLTLTYNEKNIPKSNGRSVLSKRDLQLFLKRLRSRIKDKCPDAKELRFFAVGEYGATTIRPHYHIILFNFPDSLDIEFVVNSCWGKGFVSVSGCTPGRIHYVAFYSVFGLVFPDVDYPKGCPPFKIMSRRPGIGAGFADVKHQRFFNKTKQSHLVVDGYTYRLPRYLKDKIYDCKEIRDEIKERLLKQSFDDRLIYNEVYGALDTERLAAGLPTIEEEFIAAYLSDLHKKYLNHKLHRKL